MRNEKNPSGKRQKVAWKGACSRTFFHLLNEEFGHPKDEEESASDPLGGGLKQRGCQCGMLWGASLAVGAESYRRNSDQGRAVGAAILATRDVMDSFSEITGSVNCRDITGYDFTKKLDLVRFMIKFFFFIDRRCFRMADRWAPAAIRSAGEGLSGKESAPRQVPASCASEVIKKMGGSDEEAVMAAGFAGGLGFSGNACGALAAAVWMKSLLWLRMNPGRSAYNNPDATETLDTFLKFTGSEMLCKKLSGRSFISLDDHTEFIVRGGCGELIDMLASS